VDGAALAGGIARFHPHELSPVQRLRVALARALSTEPAAVVFEDRIGQVPCRTAVADARQHAAVFVITDTERRGTALGGVVHRVERSDAASGRAVDARDGHAGRRRRLRHRP
jgi:ABC-type glutathione transport system ATPase component